MSKSINRVILLGNVTKDPEVKYTAGGVPVAKFGVATNESFKKNEEWQERTEFHNVICWQRLAELASERVKKGTRIYVEGKLQTQSWEDRTSGEKKYRTEIVANDFILLDNKPTKENNETTTEEPAPF